MSDAYLNDPEFKELRESLNSDCYTFYFGHT